MTKDKDHYVIVVWPDLGPGPIKIIGRFAREEARQHADALRAKVGFKYAITVFPILSIEEFVP